MNRNVPADHGRYAYSALIDRPKLIWPNGARLAVWVIPNVEHFHFDKPGASLNAGLAALSPDVLNYAWRDYGVRVGFWRVRDILEKHGFKSTMAINSEVCDRYPRIVEEASKLGWEFLAHGANNSTLLTSLAYEEELAAIQECLRTIELASGRKPRGWLGPALSESIHTLDILARSGVDYVADWANDEQPYPMNVKSGQLWAMPYSLETNDYPAFLNLGQSPEAFGQTIRDQFDVLYEDGASTGRVMAICLHPFLSGHPHRAKHLDKALAHIAARQEIWMATGSEILDWCKAAAV